MMIGWFGLPVILISLAGLFAGGMIFNSFDEKNENIYLSWLVHMFCKLCDKHYWLYIVCFVKVKINQYINKKEAYFYVR